MTRAILVCPLFVLQFACNSVFASGTWDFSVGASYSPTPYGGDRSGAFFSSFAAARTLADTWSVRAHVSHGFYTDQAVVGRALFTPIGIGVRRYFIQKRLQPYVEALPTIVIGQWAPPTGTKFLLPGGEIASGIRITVTEHTGLEIAAAYIGSAGMTDRRIYDAAPLEYAGLDQFLVRLETVFRFGG